MAASIDSYDTWKLKFFKNSSCVIRNCLVVNLFNTSSFSGQSLWQIIVWQPISLTHYCSTVYNFDASPFDGQSLWNITVWQSISLTHQLTLRATLYFMKMLLQFQNYIYLTYNDFSCINNSWTYYYFCSYVTLAYSKVICLFEISFCQLLIFSDSLIIWHLNKVNLINL